MIIPNAINGLDVSSVQDGGRIDAKEVKAAGFEFVYIKSSQYSSTPDLKFTKLAEKFRNAGLYVGAYHFCAHDTDPIKQAGFFYKASRGLGSKSGELPPMADWEYCTPSKYTDHPEHCVRWIESFTNECNRLWFLDNEHRKVMRKTVVYTYPNYAQNHQPDLGVSNLADRPLCYASYSNTKRYVPKSVQEVPFHKVPKPWLKATLVQYSGNDGAKVPGIDRITDRQVFLGTSGEWQDFLGNVRPIDSIQKDIKEDVYVNN